MAVLYKEVAIHIRKYNVKYDLGSTLIPEINMELNYLQELVNNKIFDMSLLTDLIKHNQHNIKLRKNSVTSS